MVWESTIESTNPELYAIAVDSDASITSYLESWNDGVTLVDIWFTCAFNDRI